LLQYLLLADLLCSLEHICLWQQAKTQFMHLHEPLLRTYY
jgi:hypothetical protein